MKSNKTFLRAVFLGFTCLSLTLLLLDSARGMSKPPIKVPETPAPQPAPSPTPQPTPVPQPAPAPVPNPEPPPQQQPPPQTSPTIPRTDFVDYILEVSEPVAIQVDKRFSSYRALEPNRAPAGAHSTDSCQNEIQNKNSFADRISFVVDEGMKAKKAQLSYVASYFGLSSDNNSYAANSLMSHPFCKMDNASLNSTYGGKRVPDLSTIVKMNQFADRLNSYRQQILGGDREGIVKAEKLWARLMMCLSYSESLTTADKASSERVAQKYAPSDYRRPAGVLFYEDPYQEAESRLNLGLFQFTPSSGGNIQSCLRSWNQTYKSCSVNNKSSSAEMIRILGSNLQTFNAFCGVTKVLDMMSVQINTTNSNNTHPSNVVNGKLKAPADRCATIFFASKSYNHFGPFQNAMGNTVDPLLTCALDVD
jgi:hypothetical protein